jgi:tol-pal system protein YbgF
MLREETPGAARSQFLVAAPHGAYRCGLEVPVGMSIRSWSKSVRAGLCGVCVLVVPLSACTGSKAASRSDVEALAKEVRDQRERQAAMDRRLADMDTRLALLAERANREGPRTTDASGAAAPPTSRDMARPNLGVVKVEPRTVRKPAPPPVANAQDVEDAGEQDPQPAIELGPRESAALEALGGGGEDLKLPVDRSVLSKEGPAATDADAEGGALAAAEEQTLARTDPKTQYNLAMRHYKGRQYANAARGFEEVADRWPDHPLADNAMYWTGVCYLAMGESALAINELQKVPVRYPKSDKVPDALFQLAEAYQRVGDTDSAKAMLTQVVQLYPKADAARPAREGLAKLNAQ